MKYLARQECTSRIKTALKRRSGKAWSVAGDRGTAWGWICISAPKDRRVNSAANPAYVDPWETPDEPSYLEVTPAPGKEGHYMTRADCQELADLLGLERPVHYQGLSFDSNDWKFYLDRAENGAPAPEPAPQPEPEPELRWVVAEPDRSLIQPMLTDVAAANLYVTAKFARLNKNNTLAEYRREVAEGPDSYHVERCKVTEIAALTDDGFDAFGNCLLDNFAWIAGKGGSNANGDWPDVDFWKMTEAQQAAWIAASYRLVIAVTAPNRDTVYVNPEGHSYARYVGI